MTAPSDPGRDSLRATEAKLRSGLFKCFESEQILAVVAFIRAAAERIAEEKVAALRVEAARALREAHDVLDFARIEVKRIMKEQTANLTLRVMLLEGLVSLPCGCLVNGSGLCVQHAESRPPERLDPQAPADEAEPPGLATGGCACGSENYHMTWCPLYRGAASTTAPVAAGAGEPSEEVPVGRWICDVRVGLVCVYRAPRKQCPGESRHECIYWRDGEWIEGMPSGWTLDPSFVREAQAITAALNSAESIADVVLPKREVVEALDKIEAALCGTDAVPSARARALLALGDERRRLNLTPGDAR